MSTGSTRAQRLPAWAPPVLAGLGALSALALVAVAARRSSADTDLPVRALVSVLVIMDPLGTVPTFLGLTAGWGRVERRQAARDAALMAGSLVLGFALFGQVALDLLGISLPSLRIAGGLLLALVALELLVPGRRGEGDEPVGREVALVPLGTPLLAGPGAIAATLVYVRAAPDTAGRIAVVGALLLAVVAVWAALRFAAGLARLLPPAGITVLTKVMGMILTALAVELVAGGVTEWVRSA